MSRDALRPNEAYGILPGFLKIGGDLSIKAVEVGSTKFHFLHQLFDLLPSQSVWFLAAWHLEQERALGHAAPKPAPPAPVQTTDPPSQDDLEKEIDRVQGGLVNGLHAWLRTLEGRKFESKERAKSQIDAITRIVRKAGRRLLFNDHPVTLSAVSGTRQTRPTIQVLGRDKGKRVVLLNSISMPQLSTGSID